MKYKILRSLTYVFLFLSAAVWLRADREADRRREVIPTGHTMHPPIHKSIVPFASGASPTGYTPQQLRHAYGFDQLGTMGAGQIIAIVDAYGSPTIQADLDTFCAQFNIPSTTVAVYYPQGQPGSNSGWAGETSLDVEWAHAIAPGATIALVVAKSASTTDLFAAVDYAVGLGAKQISMSWGGSEFSTEATSDFHFNVSGVSFFASSGDSGAGVSYPASSPFVVGVGGTSFYLDSFANVLGETAWSGSGGGASAYEPIPAYQAGWWSGATRGVPDVAYDADPNTGVPVYQTGSGWQQFGGTSMSAPQWAALFALTNSLRAQSIDSAPSLLYSLANSNYAGYFRDITSGGNGNPAGTGYDLVTGLGAPLANQLVLALAGGSSQVAPAAFSPPAGTYANAQIVTITSATSGATIIYTTDGSTPSHLNGAVYSGPVSVSTTTMLKAFAYASGLADSPESNGVYAITGSPGAVVNVMYNFSLLNRGGGYSPHGALLRGSDGNFYGVTGSGGSNGSGTVFKLTPTGILTTLVSFNGANGALPFGGLVQGSDGNFYGTTGSGGGGLGEGTVFKMTPAGVLTTLVSFNGANGGFPSSGLTQGNDGNFYGVTPSGGSGNDGIVFKMTPGGVLTTLVSFNGANGNGPTSLIQGRDGNFYGTTSNPVGGNIGTIFKMTPGGVLTTLVSFNGANGSAPVGLIQASDGNFYGTTSAGGSAGSGTVFQMTPGGVLTTLVSFSGTNGSVPGGLIQGGDGNFYGMTKNGGSASAGTVFKVTPAGILTTLVSFDVLNGEFPDAALIQGSDGNFYGATVNGGTLGGGNVFELIVPPSPVAAPAFYPPAGTYANAQTVTIATATPGATIRFTTDGSTPTETNGTMYSVPVNIGATTTLKAIAYKGGIGDSPVTSGTYSILPAAAAPVFSPASGTYMGPQAVTITSATPGATIRYTTDGSAPTETSGTIYSGPVNLNVTVTLQAMAYASGFADSPVAGGTYTIIPLPAAAPVFSPAAGTYADTQSVAITSASAGTTIRYTTDGSTPTETNGTIYSSPVSINSTTMLKAIAYGNFFADGPVTAGFYTIAASQTPVFNVLHDFAAINNDGANPAAALLESAGSFYGTTKKGGGSNAGTVFKINSNGVVATLISFNSTNGSSPQAALIQGSDGNLYGMTTNGGSLSNAGTLFKMPPAGTLTTLLTFQMGNGAYPQGALVQGSDGNFYGTTSGGASGSGTVFVVSPTGFLSTLFAFQTSGNGIYQNGASPFAGLVQGTDGNFYGTTLSGGSVGNGTVFEITPAGVLTTLFSFNGANGDSPLASLVQGSDGNFYGTTQKGGSANDGTVFKMTPSGVLTTLVSFNGTNGALPQAALLQAGDGNFYGTTKTGGSNNEGTLFKITPAGVLTTLVSFNGANGASPLAALVQDGDGNFYGTASAGGVSNQGIVFELIIPRVAIPVFSPLGGTYTTAQSVTITSATSGVTIRYTTDGSAPTEANGIVYSGPVTIDSTTTLQAIAYEAGFTDSTVSSAVYTITPPPPPGWMVKDFDGDSGADILWRNPGTGDFGIWSMAGTAPAGFTPIGNVPAPWSVVAVGDFNQDGKADLLWRNTTTGEVGVMLMNGTAISSYVGLGVLDSSWTVAGLGDFNNDGQTDILWQNTSGALGFWALNGTTVTGFTSIGTLPAPWTIAGVGDFNGDGKSDLLWYDPTTGNLVVSLMNGAAVTGFEAVGNLPLPWTVAGVADFNGDGSPDLLLHDSTTGNIGIFLMNGATPTGFDFLGNVPAPWQPLD